MSERTSYKRFPAVKCWIKHIIQSEFDESDNSFHTIFGKVKRIRIIGTIIEKNEELTEFDEYNIGLEDDAKENVQLIFKLDDSTSLIRAVIESVNPEKYRNYNVGHTVDVVGRPRKKEGILSLWIEIIRKVEEPNYILLREAEIVRRIKSGDIQKITGTSDNKTNELSKEIDVNNLFEDD